MPNRRLIPSGGLNKDIDKYNLPEGDYIDARNIVVDTSSLGGGGSLKTFPNIEDETDATLGDLLDVGWSIKEAVSDNEGVIYCLLIDSDEAVLGKIDIDNSYTPLLLYTHEVTTDFQPDMRVIGDVVVWNYHAGGTPLSWLVTRTPVTDGSAVLKDITLIKEPPKMEFSITPLAGGQEPRDITLSSQAFSEDEATGYTIATAVVDDPTSATHTMAIVTAVDGGGTDASARFTFVGQELRTVGVFDWSTADDRTFTINISATNEFALSYVESFTITLNNVAPSITVPATANLDENLSSGQIVIPSASVTGLSGSANGTDSGCTYSILSGNTGGVFAIDSSNGQVTTTTGLNHESPDNPYTLVIQIDDGGLTATDSTVVTVNDVAEAPVTIDGSASNLATSIYTGDLGALTTNDDGGALTYSTVSAPSSGTVTYNQVLEEFEYIPDGTASSDSFTWKANNGLDSNVSTFTISHQVFDLASELTYVAGDADVLGVAISPAAGANQFQGGTSGSQRELDFDVIITVTNGTVPVDLDDVTVVINFLAGSDITTITEVVSSRTSPDPETIVISYKLGMKLTEPYLNMDSDLSFTYQVTSL